MTDKIKNALTCFRELVRRTSLLPWILLIILIVVYYLSSKETSKVITTMKEQENNITALQDTVKTVINEDSSKTSTIRAFEYRAYEDFLAIKIKDSTIESLQGLVTEYKDKLDATSAAVVFSSETKIDRNFKSTVRFDKDSFPEYYSDINMGKWVTGNTLATKDSTYLNLSIHDDYDIFLGTEGRGKNKRPFADVTTHNPYNAVTTLRTFRVTAKPDKKFGIGMHVGYGLSSTPSLRLGPVVSVGLNYNLLEF